jgi:hypothetical protein
MAGTLTGQLALGWLVLLTFRLIGLVAWMRHDRPLQNAATAAGIVVAPLLFAPPLLTRTPGWPRRWWAVLTAGWGVSGLALLAALGGPGRPFQLVASPASFVFLASVALGALLAAARRHAALVGAPDPLRAPWFWGMGATAGYAALFLCWMPLVELFYARDPQLGYIVHMALTQVQTLLVLALAWGARLEHAASPSGAPVGVAGRLEGA